MEFQRNIQEKIAKYKAFYEDNSPGQIMVVVSPYTFGIDYSSLGIASRTLDSWDFEREAEVMIDKQIRNVRFYNEYTKELDHDFIPTVSGFLGIGVNSSYFGGSEVVFGKDTSWSHPVVNQWEDMNNLVLSGENRWVKILKRMAQRSVEMCDGDFVPTTHGHFAPSDMANALRGNQLFYDFYDAPEKVHQLLDVSADAIIWLQRELRKIIPQALGGSIAAHMWMPGEALFMSEDAADLCSPDLYREFFRGYTQKVIDNIGGAHIHHHGKGMHVHGEITKLEKLKSVEISWDPNCPRPIDNLEALFEQNNGIPLMTRCTVKDVYDKIDLLKQGKIVLMLIVESLEEAKEAISFIHRHSRI